MWTFSMSQNESAIISIGEVLPSGPDPGFWPWIRVYNPLGDLVGGGSQYGALAAQVGFVASLTGTYTVVAGSADSGYAAEGNYTLRLAKMPGTFVDESGGPLQNGGNHTGHLDLADLDMWSFTATQNDSAIIILAEIPVPSDQTDPGFWPWLRVWPTGRAGCRWQPVR
ncbi:MAG: hypothetical protein R2712_08155 [Vicinamibacterales bacterium]